MFTGDYPPHNVWLQSREKNIQSGRVTIELVKKYFPNSTVIPNIGNHDGYPTNRQVVSYQPMLWALLLLNMYYYFNFIFTIDTYFVTVYLSLVWMTQSQMLHGSIITQANYILIGFQEKHRLSFQRPVSLHIFSNLASELYRSIQF